MTCMQQQAFLMFLYVQNSNALLKLALGASAEAKPSKLDLVRPSCGTTKCCCAASNLSNQQKCSQAPGMNPHQIWSAYASAASAAAAGCPVLLLGVHAQATVLPVEPHLCLLQR